MEENWGARDWTEPSSPTIGSANPMIAWEIEHLLWPAKILGCDIPNYIVPIRPRWATHLFDSGLALGTLFGADTDLALNPESIYYRSARNGLSRSFGRLIWYISRTGEFQVERGFGHAPDSRTW